MSKLVEQYNSCLDKFIKICGVSQKNMYLIRDCPRDEIWRLKHFSDYKHNRADSSSPSKYGPYIKYLNEHYSDKYAHTFRVNNAEADDVIAILVQLFSTINPKQIIYIVATDSDYTQLLSYPNVKIYSPKGGWEQITCDNPTKFLADKILAGDKSDCVPRADLSNILQMIRNAQLIDMQYIPRYIQDRVINQLPETLHDFVPINFVPRSMQLGLCCLNTELRKKNIFCSRTHMRATLDRTGSDPLIQSALKNCEDLIRMIQWNADHGIRVFRISSDIFPRKSDLKAPQYDLDFAQPLLTKAGNLARKYKQRLSFHPGQYNVVGTPTPSTFESTIRDLDYQAETLDRMACDQNSILVVHGGGLYGNKQATLNRWISNYKLLPERIRRRLVLENCEKCFSITDCLYVSEAINIPVVFDVHHYECYRQLHPKEHFEPPEFYIPTIINTWHKRNMIPYFHISEQCCGAQIGKHSDLIDDIPQYLLDITDHFDLDVEAKLKEQAINKLYKKYPAIDPHTGINPPLQLAPLTSKLKIIIKKPKLDSAPTPAVVSESEIDPVPDVVPDPKPRKFIIRLNRK